MVFLWRTPIAVAAAGLLAACAQSGPPSLMPSAAQNQAPPAGHAAPAFGQAPARHNRGRILYIADIDGQPGLGQIHVYTAGMKNPRQLRLITQGAGRPFGLWVNSKNILYVANESNKVPASVTEFKPGASSPFLTISDVMGQPGSVAVDRAGNVYVNENVQDEGWVQVFAPGQITPERSIDTGIGGYAFDPGSMAFDPQGDLVVAEQAKLALQMVKIAPGYSQRNSDESGSREHCRPGHGHRQGRQHLRRKQRWRIGLGFRAGTDRAVAHDLERSGVRLDVGHRGRRRLSGERCRYCVGGRAGRERTDDDDRLRVLRAGDGSQQIIGIGTLRILSIGGPIAADVNE